MSSMSPPDLGVATHNIHKNIAQPTAAVNNDTACSVAVLPTSNMSHPPRSAPQMPTHTANAVLRTFLTSLPTMKPPTIPIIVHTIQSEPCHNLKSFMIK